MMLFESTNRQSPNVNLAEALIQGQAPDKGLYLPVFIPYFAPGELAALQGKTYPEIAVAVLSKFTGGTFTIAALEEMCRVLSPRGFLAGTLYCNPADRLREHFPELHEYRVVPLGDSAVLINRRRDGSLELREDPVFHGGTGATVEMREFGITDLTAKLRAAGFREVRYLTENVPEIGVIFDHDVSQPFIARKEPFLLNAAAQSELVRQWSEARAAQKEAQEQVARVRASRWLRLGRQLGLGPQGD
jgi:hypothetical protein